MTTARTKNKWWGYLHETGGICILSAENEASVKEVRSKRSGIIAEVKPFNAVNIESATITVRAKLKNSGALIQDTKNMWWGYLHAKNDTVKVEKFFNYREMTVRKNSVFLKKIVGPFEAKSRDEAYKEAERLIKNAKRIRRTPKAGTVL